MSCADGNGRVRTQQSDRWKHEGYVIGNALHCIVVSDERACFSVIFPLPYSIPNSGSSLDACFKQNVKEVSPNNV
jgi:hypothetical protein